MTYELSQGAFMMKRIFILPLTISLAIVFTACGKPSDDEIKQLLEKSKENLVFVEGGTFMMGDGGATYIDQNGVNNQTDAWTGYDDNKPAHKVTLDSYHIQKYEVTWAEFDTFSKATGLPLRDSDLLGKGLRAPIIPAGVGTWYNAKAYCQWLAKESSLPYDLPTEAQWEYAARSRGRADVLYATDSGWLKEGWNFGASYKGLPLSTPKPVGLHPPNPLGIYDMMGNVAEFVEDWYDPKYYAKSPRQNPKGPDSGDEKVNRGGSVIGSPEYDTVYSRAKSIPDKDGHAFHGVRCVLNVQKGM